MNFAGATLRGEVRSDDCGQHAGGFALGDVVRLAGAARSGEVQVERCYCNGWWGLLNSIMHDEGAESDLFYFKSLKVEQIVVEQIFADGFAKLSSGHSESAPVHISVASARRRGPTLAVELSWRDCERSDPRQLCQLRWRSAKAGGLWWSSGLKVDPACRASFEVNFEDCFCLILNLFKFVLLGSSEFLIR